MSVSEQTPYQRFTGNGVADEFSLPYGADLPQYIKVTVNGVPGTYGGTYTVTGLTEASGTLVFADPPAADAEIVTWRDTTTNRVTDYVNHGMLDAEALDADIDRVVHLIQENEAKYDRLLDGMPDIQVIIDNIEDIAAAADLVTTGVVDSDEEMGDVTSGPIKTVLTTGYYEKGDGGSGWHYYDDNELVWKLIAVHGISILQFGAKAEEDFDSQPAIQNAIEWAAANNVRKVYVPHGTYELTAVVDPHTPGTPDPPGVPEFPGAHLLLNTALGVTLEGSGNLYGSILKAMTDDKVLLEVTGNSIGCGLRNISLDRDCSVIGGANVSKAQTGAHGVHFHECWNNPFFLAENVIVTHHDCGISSSTARMLSSTWVGCSFLDNRSHGAWLRMNNEERFIACIFNGNGWYDVGGSRVKEADPADRGAGLRIGASDQILGAASVGGVYIDSPTTWGNAGHGIHIEGHDYGVYPASAIQITNGFIDSSGLSGIFIQNAWGVHISSTKFSWNDQRGLHIGYGALEVTVAGCEMHDNVLEGTLIYGDAKNVTLSGCQQISNNRDVDNYAYGIRIVGPCSHIHILGGSSGNGPPITTNGESPGADPLGEEDYTILRDCQFGGVRIEKIEGADSPAQVYIRDLSFPGMDAARLVTYSSGEGVEVGNEIYCDVGRDWTPVITDSADPPVEITAYTVDRAKYWRTATDKVEITLRFTITDDGSVTGNLGVSLPVTSDWQAGPLPAFNHGTGASLVGIPYGAGMWIQASGGGNIIGEHTYSVGGSYSLTVVT